MRGLISCSISGTIVPDGHTVPVLCDLPVPSYKIWCPTSGTTFVVRQRNPMGKTSKHVVYNTIQSEEEEPRPAHRLLNGRLEGTPLMIHVVERWQRLSFSDLLPLATLHTQLEAKVPHRYLLPSASCATPPDALQHQVSCGPRGVVVEPRCGTACSSFSFPDFPSPSAMRLSTQFRSLKVPHPREFGAAKPANFSTAVLVEEASKAASSSSPPSKPSSRCKGGVGNEGTKKNSNKKGSAWSVYLIVSSRVPRTYVGVTTNFDRRLKEHNGELKGGAKASRAGRPWLCACIIRGFRDQSEACEFEARWKSISRKSPRKAKKGEDNSTSLLRHREEALHRVKASMDCGHLEIQWSTGSSQPP